MGYALPTTTDWVTASWQAHKNRNPPSSEPGTDYGSAYGQPCFAVGDGTVTGIKTTTTGGTGRYIQYLLDDGRETRPLHLSAISVSLGQRVSRGQRIGTTGASGFGSEWGYGAHVHQTLWPSRAWAANTIDFERYVGAATPGPTPTPPPLPKSEVDMLIMQLKTWDGGGLNGVCYAVAPGSLYVVRDQAEADQLAAVWNQNGKLWSISDQWMNQHLDACGIPRELLYAAAGSNWSWAKDAAQGVAGENKIHTESDDGDG